MNTTLRVSSWNIREGILMNGPDLAGPDLAGPHLADPDLTAAEALAAEASAQRPDVLALQEVPFDPEGGSALLDTVAATTGLTQVLSCPLSSAMHHRDGRSGIALLSRRPWQAREETLLPNPDLVGGTEHHPVTSWDKGVLAGLLTWQQQQLWLGCAHLYPFQRLGTEADAPAVLPVWQHLANFLLRLGTAPLVLCADFNTERRELLTDLLPERPLRRSIRERTSHRGLAVDDILYDPVLSLNSSSVHHSVSDHALCSVELEVLP